MNGLIDTNLLVYAANRDSPFFQKTCHFIESRLNSCDRTYLCWPVVYEFLRVTTHPKVFATPLTWKQATQFLDPLLTHPNFEFLPEGDEHYLIVKEVFAKIQRVAGNFMHDCHIAALLKENGAKTIFTRDIDFRLFDFLETVDPLG